MANNPYTPSAASLNAGPAQGAGFRDLSAITGWLSWLLALGAAVSIFNIIASLAQPANGVAAASVGWRMLIAAMAQVDLVLSLITVIIFGRWIYLAHKNLPEIGARYLRIGPGWALGSFFVPIVNLWVPYQAMRDLAKASRNPVRWEQEDTPPGLVAWWLLWLLAGVVSQVLSALRLDPLVDPQVTASAGVVEGVSSLALYLLARLVVRRIWHDQALRMQPGAVA